MLEDFPQRVADILEAITRRIRALTVDPASRAIKWVTLGLVALAVVTVAFVFFLIGTFRISGELAAKACGCDYGMEISYGVIGGLILLLAMFMWSRRTRRSDRKNGQ